MRPAYGALLIGFTGWSAGYCAQYEIFRKLRFWTGVFAGAFRIRSGKDRFVTTDALQDRLLTAIRPNHMAEPPARWQQRKSALTRQRIVEAGFQCLVENGYSGLTTAAVAERCGLSRGAMHHHFPTRLELVADVVDHVFYQRMQGFLRDYFAALKVRGEEEMVEVACSAHWQSVQTREYAAYLELAAAARTDAELAHYFDPAARRYDEVWVAEMIEAFPQYRDHWDALKLANDIVTTTHIGMVMSAPVLGKDGERLDRLQNLLVRIVRGLYQQD